MHSNIIIRMLILHDAKGHNLAWRNHDWLMNSKGVDFILEN